MMKKRRIVRQRERGVALLFALGMLSLLMVLGIAFVTNAVIARKTAHNNSSRSQAKMLAQSAVNRVAIAVMEYQMEIDEINAPPNTIVKTQSDQPFSDFSTVVSYSKYPSYKSISTSTAKPGDVEIDDDLGLNGILPPFERSYVKTSSSQDTYFRDMEDSSKTGRDLLRTPKWVFVEDGANPGKLIGRFAYRVLPPASNTQISLEKYLRGAYNPRPAAEPQYTELTDIVFDKTPLAFWENSKSPATEPNDKTPLVGSLDRFFAGWGDQLTSSGGNWSRDDARKWLTKWFSDSENSPDLEIYEVDVDNGSGANMREYRNRFSLWDRTWADYVNPGNTSSGQPYTIKDYSVNCLFRDSQKFERGDIFNGSSDPENVTGKPEFGLPFMGLIGDYKGSFGDIATLRKQIAANLIDYNDGDDLPTSDSFHELWSDSSVLNSKSSWPTYTGNEKTAYINEFALGIQLEADLENPTAGDLSGFPVSLKTKLAPELIAELIDIYNVTRNTYKLYMNMGDFEVKLKISAKGVVTYEDDKGNPGSKHFEISNGSDTSFATAAGAKTSIVIDFSAGTWNNGYITGSAVAANPIEATWDMSSKIAAEVPAGSKITSAKVDGVKFEMSSLEVDFGALALMDNKGSNEAGCDFVRWDYNSKVTPSFAGFTDNRFTVAYDQNYAGGYFTVGNTAANKVDLPEFSLVYLGGFEARDPRQNLNFTDGGSGVDSDWTEISNTSVVLRDYNGNKVDGSGADTTAIPNLTMTINSSGTTRTITGKVNSESNPSSPKKGSTSLTDVDPETVTDPAASGTSAMSTAYIRNAPMKSPWELGAIHRAMPWQTINLKSALNRANQPFTPEDHDCLINSAFDPDTTAKGTMAELDITGNASGYGTSYAKGDGAILDQVKMRNKIVSAGKLDVDMLRSNAPGADNRLLRAVLKTVPLGETYATVNEDVNDIPDGDADRRVTKVQNVLQNAASSILSRAQILSDSFPLDDDQGVPTGRTDAQKEEMAGKLLQLFKAGPGQVTSFRALIVAQSVLDVAGPVRKLLDNGTLSNEHMAQYGVFDYAPDPTNNGKFVYFDEITGEVLMLVTFDRNPFTGKIKVRGIEYLDSVDYSEL